MDLLSFDWEEQYKGFFLPSQKPAFSGRLGTAAVRFCPLWLLAFSATCLHQFLLSHIKFLQPTNCLFVTDKKIVKTNNWTLLARFKMVQIGWHQWQQTQQIRLNELCIIQFSLFKLAPNKAILCSFTNCYWPLRRVQTSEENRLSEQFKIDVKLRVQLMMSTISLNCLQQGPESYVHHHLVFWWMND